MIALCTCIVIKDLNSLTIIRSLYFIIMESGLQDYSVWETGAIYAAPIYHVIHYISYRDLRHGSPAVAVVITMEPISTWK